MKRVSLLCVLLLLAVASIVIGCSSVAHLLVHAGRPNTEGQLAPTLALTRETAVQPLWRFDGGGKLSRPPAENGYALLDLRTKVMNCASGGVAA